ncbi:hypothetical protein NW768_010803 [Fusarium equiseti]|uniref:AAA+ ATPase domain-containing protein n=1 Tax=Fusarium equiseti TaxID=61235 RepID=A0ABQ8R000_FUSEQ|nr:hypothetical protein NW768_010803 [Fusarium equiseti]
MPYIDPTTPQDDSPSNQPPDADPSSSRSESPAEDLPKTPDSTHCGGSEPVLTDLKNLKQDDAQIVADSIANLFVEAVASRLSKLKSLEEHAKEAAENQEEAKEEETKEEETKEGETNDDNANADESSEAKEEKELKWTDLLVDEDQDFELLVDKSPSQIEWSRRKREEGQQNEHMDRIMSMVGHEQVKAYFLSVLDKISISKRWGKSMDEWSFDLVLHGNDGTGKRRIAQLYAEFLHSVGVVSTRKFAINDSHWASDEDAEASVIFFSAADNIDRTSEVERILEISEKSESRLVVILSYKTFGSSSQNVLDTSEVSRRRFSNRLILENYNEKEILQLLKLLCTKPEFKLQSDNLLEFLARQIQKKHAGKKFRNAHKVKDELEMVWKKSQRRADEEWYSWAKTHSPEDGQEFSKQDGITLDDILGPAPENFRSKSEAWKKLENLVGLEEVKENLGRIFDMAEFNSQQERHGRQPLDASYNLCFLGDPGVGKTTVAELYSQILSELGIVSRGHIVSKQASDLLGEYIGHSEANTTKALEEAKGGVLVIDDAHLLYQESCKGKGSSDSFRNGIIDTLVAKISGGASEDRCVILCGYTDRMQKMFLSTNPGLQKRFPVESCLKFENYDDEQLQQILRLKMKRDELTATDEASEVAREVLNRTRRRPNFGNGGDVETLLSRAKIRRITRLRNAKCPFLEFQDRPLEPEDFDPDFDRASRADKHRNALFQDFVGFDNVIGKFQGYQKMANGMRRCGIDPKSYLPWAFVFSGPPGTGKTSTARKVGRLFYDMGFISSDEVVTCSVTDLIGQYIGSTGPKVISQFEQGLGKVLFIDEAYRLVGDSYHKDAIGEIVDTMTNPRFARNMVVILAGYGDEMETLLSTNPGLRSRFPTIIEFPHLAPEDCLCLLSRLLAKLNIRLSSSVTESGSANDTIIGMLRALTGTKGWASGRDIENLSRTITERMFTKVGDSEDVFEPGALKVSFYELVDCLEAMLKQKGGRFLEEVS